MQDSLLFTKGTCLQYLYYFSNESAEIIEIKRLDLDPSAPKSEVYKWLYHSTTKDQILELRFISMCQRNETSLREFVEAKLEFNESSATFYFHGNDQMKLKRNPTSEISNTLKEKIQAYLR